MEVKFSKELQDEWNKNKDIFKEYINGFGSVESIVDKFQGMSSITAEEFVLNKIKALEEQLKYIDFHRENVKDDIRKALTEANSRFATLDELEKEVKQKITYYTKDYKKRVKENVGKRRDKTVAVNSVEYNILNYVHDLPEDNKEIVLSIVQAKAAELASKGVTNDEITRKSS
ncbi:hypothetical protein [Vallitalea guaymasensis]|uniref:hypothetical protein n=1 Tax=Vallitalea guaymasensis TaxID=1185412 RepID=UPI000DE44F5C|nr:hypothetical protein [Vallitalea guaymasensis]